MLLPVCTLFPGPDRLAILSRHGEPQLKNGKRQDYHCGKYNAPGPITPRQGSDMPAQSGQECDSSCRNTETELDGPR